MSHRVLVTDKLSEEGLALLRAEPSIEVVVNTKLAADVPALRAALAEAEGIIIRSGTQLTAEVLEGQTRLKAIVRAGVGVDNIDVPAATKRGIVVMNTPGGNTVSTAEHTVAMMLALSRNIPKANESFKSGKWERNKFTGTQLEGKTLGVVGLGRVGLAVAQRARGFDMKVVGFDPFLSAERAAELGIESVPGLDDLWGRCDYITLHTPLSAETRNLVDAAAIARMKPGVRIINCARGGLIDEDALKQALDSSHVAGAAIDVFDPEPPPADHALVNHAQGRGDAPPRPRPRRRRWPWPWRPPVSSSVSSARARSASPSTCRASAGPSWMTCGCTSTSAADWACSTPRWIGAPSARRPFGFAGRSRPRTRG